MPDWKKMSGFAIALARVMVHVSQCEKERREGGGGKKRRSKTASPRDETKQRGRTVQVQAGADNPPLQETQMKADLGSQDLFSSSQLAADSSQIS